jgi:ABC-type nitrate/sulfonate/bicarbonate transport system substrate-binding protein
MVDVVRLGVFSPSAVVAVGTDAGAFESAGIALEISAVRSSISAFTDLASGALDLLVTSPDNVLAYRLNRSNVLGTCIDAQILLGIDRGLGLSLMAAPAGNDRVEVAGGRQLLGVDAPATGFAYAAYALMDRLGFAKHGLDIVELGSTPLRRDALTAGACSLTMLNAGHDLLAENAGCGRVARAVETLGPYLGSALVGLQSWASEHKSLLDRFTDAWLESTRAVVEPASVAAVTSRIKRLLGCDEATASRAVETLVSRTEGLVVDGRIDEAELQTVIELRAAHGGFDGEAIPRAPAAVETGLVRERAG